MPSKLFPESVRQLVFEHIDSVEQLEVLLYMRLHREVGCNSHSLSAELRSNPQSVLNRLTSLEEQGLVSCAEPDARTELSKFSYAPRTEDLDAAVAELAEIYKVRPHKIFELIFSPLKKGRQFADAFLVGPSKGPTKKDSDNG